MRDGTLLLLHAADGDVTERDLVSWLEHSNASVYRRDVLRQLHRARLIEYDATAKTARISPRGIEYVEESVLPAVRT